MKSKTQGFTMVELLVTIVILGVVSTIGIVSIINIRKNQEIKFNKSQIEVLRQAGKTYFTDHKLSLPTEPMQTKDITLKELIELNYLDSLLNYHKEPYDMESYVRVRFLGNGIYAYTVYLINDGDKIEDEDPNKASISYDFKYFSNEGKNHYTNKNTKLIVNMNDIDGIAAYRYKITSNKRKTESDYIYINSLQSVSEKIVIDTDDYEDDIYKVSITLWDSKGYKTTYTGDGNQIYIDTKNPTCKVIATDSNGATYTPGTWTNLTISVKGKCSDTLSGCVSNITDTFSSEMNATKTISGGAVFDKAGNKTVCDTIKIKIDKTAPVCTNSSVYSDGSKYDSTWTNMKVTVKGKCSDTKGVANSGCKSDVSKQITKEGSITYSPGTVYDNAGNKTVCDTDQVVKYDITFPEKPTILNPALGEYDTSEGYVTLKEHTGLEGWTNKNIILTVSSTDSISGINKWSYSYDNAAWIDYADSAKEKFETPAFSKERNQTAYIRVCDKANNCSVGTTTIKIDKTAPNCTSSRVPSGSSLWVNYSVGLNGICSDESGVANSGCRGNVSKSLSAEGKYNESPGTVYDKAGNNKVCDSIAVNIDKTPPTVKLTVTSSNSNYNTTNPNLTVNITDVSTTKYDITVGNCSSNNYSNMAYTATLGKNMTKNISVHNAYDGSVKTICVTAIDEAGNKTDQTINYTVYKDCSSTSNVTKTESCDSWGSCSDSCGGTMYGTKVYSWNDPNTGTACSTRVENGCSQGCGGSTKACTATNNRTTCTKPCGGGTWNVINSCIQVATDNSKYCSGYYNENGAVETCGGQTKQYTTDWDQGECDADCGDGTRIDTRLYDTIDIYGNICKEDREETRKKNCTVDCTKKCSDKWANIDCKCTLETGKCKKTRKCWQVNEDGEKVADTTETQTKSCTYPSHTHDWTARGTQLITDNANWTCSGPTVHTGLNQHYNIYCRICAKKKTTSPKWVCSVAPYGTSDGWKVFDDSKRN